LMPGRCAAGRATGRAAGRAHDDCNAAPLSGAVRRIVPHSRAASRRATPLGPSLTLMRATRSEERERHGQREGGRGARCVGQANLWQTTGSIRTHLCCIAYRAACTNGARAAACPPGRRTLGLQRSCGRRRHCCCARLLSQWIAIAHACLHLVHLRCGDAALAGANDLGLQPQRPMRHRQSGSHLWPTQLFYSISAVLYFIYHTVQYYELYPATAYRERLKQGRCMISWLSVMTSQIHAINLPVTVTSHPIN
jgi:hypothetical protein